MLASMAAYLSTYTILDVGMVRLNEEQKYAISFQRICKVAVNLSQNFIKFLLISSKECLDELLRKIELFSDEIIDPNYKKRKTSIGIMHGLLGT